MADAESPERLPVGWTEQVRTKDGQTVKFYYNIITGKRLESKADLPGYGGSGRPSQGTGQQARAPNEDNTEKTLTPMLAEKDSNPDWLPQGWRVEVNAKSSGSKYKRYIDPSTGRRFSSKPEVMRYLYSDKGNESVSELRETSTESTKDPPVIEAGGAETHQKREEPPTEKRTSDRSSQKEKSTGNSKKVEVVRSTAEGLPPGWIKEIKIEKTGKKIRKDPYFTDPVSRLVFRSLPDALRYAKNKDTKECAIKPRKREDVKFLSDDISFGEGQQSLEKTTEDGAEEKESDVPTSIQSPTSTPGSKRKRGRPAAAPSTNNITQAS